MAIPSSCICIASSSLSKLVVLSALMNASFSSHQAIHSNSIPIFTDCAKREGGVGTLVVFPNLTICHTFPPSLSILTDALITLFMTVHRILDLASDTYSVFSDSKNALRSLKYLLTRNTLTSAIQRSLTHE